MSTGVANVLTLECEHGIAFAALLLPISQAAVVEFFNEAPALFGAVADVVPMPAFFSELEYCEECHERLD